MKRELIEIGTTIRVENGPARKTAVATSDLLANSVTASHYQVGLKDAMGKMIVLGEPMTYLDYKGEWVWFFAAPAALTVGTPELGTPAITVFVNYPLTADAIDVGQPALGAPALSQLHALATVGFDVSMILGSPALSSGSGLALTALLREIEKY